MKALVAVRPPHARNALSAVPAKWVVCVRLSCACCSVLGVMGTPPPPHAPRPHPHPGLISSSFWLFPESRPGWVVTSNRGPHVPRPGRGPRPRGLRRLTAGGFGSAMWEPARK
jgi:hypothetical protein